MDYSDIIAICYWLIVFSRFFFRYIGYFEQYAEFDSIFSTVEPANPWSQDNTEFWEQELSLLVSHSISILTEIIIGV